MNLAKTFSKRIRSNSMRKNVKYNTFNIPNNNSQQQQHPAVFAA